jgi:hypothetical protein
MAGYSGTPLVKKLGIKADHRIALVNPPPDFQTALGELPSGVKVQTGARGRGPFDVVILFVADHAALVKAFATLAKRLTPAGGFWVSWPKRASGVPTDLTEDRIRAVGLEIGLVDNKVCAVDETWSGLRFVIRLVDRR